MNIRNSSQSCMFIKFWKKNLRQKPKLVSVRESKLKFCRPELGFQKVENHWCREWRQTGDVFKFFVVVVVTKFWSDVLFFESVPFLHIFHEKSVFVFKIKLHISDGTKTQRFRFGKNSDNFLICFFLLWISIIFFSVSFFATNLGSTGFRLM